MTQVRVPTPLRKLTGGSEAVEAAGRHRRRPVRRSRHPLSRHPRAHLRRVRPGAPLRQRLRQRRGHPLPAAARDAGEGGRRGLDRAGHRGRPLSPCPMPAHPAQARFSAGPTASGEGPVVLPTVLQLIGNTPLVEIQRVRDGVPAGVRLFGKLEGFNPGGSVKDRPALRMVQEGIRQGRLTSGQDHPRLDLRQHRHRARDDRRGARLSGHAGHAGQREPRAQADRPRRSARS